jgi:hypothetical protein
VLLSKTGGKQESLALHKHKGTKLKVFSGREERLNRAIFLILHRDGILTRYDLFKQIRSIKGFRHTKIQVLYRRVDALFQQGWLDTHGVRITKALFSSPLYQLNVRALAAMEFDKTDLNELLQTASKEQIQKLINALSPDTKADTSFC